MIFRKGIKLWEVLLALTVLLVTAFFAKAMMILTEYMLVLVDVLRRGIAEGMSLEYQLIFISIGCYLCIQVISLFAGWAFGLLEFMKKKTEEKGK